jgi:hypothetical protein
MTPTPDLNANTCSHFQKIKNPIEINSFVALTIMDTQKKPLFDKRIFWDVDFENLDYDAQASFIIMRVFDRGDVEDIRQ